MPAYESPNSASEATTSPPVILTFHKICPGFSFGSTNFSPRRFRRLLLFLTQTGFCLTDCNNARSGEKPKRLVLSFDDGYQHLAEVLPPLMSEFEFVPIVFMPTAWIGKGNRWDYSYRLRPMRHLERGAVRELAALGVEFGSHGHSHIDLTSCPPDVLRQELDYSRKVLEDITGSQVGAISYPFGRYDTRVLAAVAEAGFSRGYTMDFPASDDSSLAMGRVAVYGYDTHLSVRRKLTPNRLQRLEYLKVRLTNRLSAGTVLLNRLRGTSQP